MKRLRTKPNRRAAKGEHPFLILKRIFGFNKVRYRGWTKCQPLVCGLRIGQFVHGQKSAVAANIGDVRLKSAIDTKNQQNSKFTRPIGPLRIRFSNV